MLRATVRRERVEGQVHEVALTVRRVASVAAVLVAAAMTTAVGYGVVAQEAWANDSAPLAEGPLASGRYVSSTVGFRGDTADYYYFYVTVRSTVLFRGATQEGTDASLRVDGYKAGYAWLVAADVSEGRVETLTLEPGAYYVCASDSDFNRDAGGTYWFSVTGSKVVTKRPEGVWRALGQWEPSFAGSTGFSDAPIVPPFNIVEATLTSNQVHRYRFFVTRTTVVRIGHGSDYLGYDWGHVRGRLYNSSFTAVGVPLDGSSRTTCQTLTPGVYYLKWTPVSVGTLATPYYYKFGIEGAYVTAHPFASMTKPYAPQTASRGVAFNSYGKISPAHSAGATGVLVKAYRYERGHYVYKKSYAATIKDYTSSSSKYVARVSLPSSGAWRIRAYHRDSGHLKSYSSYRYVTVR